MKYTESIITNDMNHCYICGSSDVEIHHIYGAANRSNSTKLGLVVPLCRFHHTGSEEAVHFNKKTMADMHKLGQQCFDKKYPQLNFKEIFGRNYL